MAFHEMLMTNNVPSVNRKPNWCCSCGFQSAPLNIWNIIAWSICVELQCWCRHPNVRRLMNTITVMLVLTISRKLIHLWGFSLATSYFIQSTGLKASTETICESRGLKMAKFIAISSDITPNNYMEWFKVLTLYFLK